MTPPAVPRLFPRSLMSDSDSDSAHSGSEWKHHRAIVGPCGFHSPAASCVALRALRDWESESDISDRTRRDRPGAATAHRASLSSNSPALASSFCRFADLAVLSQGVTTIRASDIRRAVFSVFFAADGGPLNLTAIVRLTKEQAGLDLAALPGIDPRRRVSDMMRYQVRMGRAEATGRGTYLLHVDKFSVATKRRCSRWRELAERRERYPRWVSLSRTVP